MELILASASQRRRELMRNCGYEFSVIPSLSDEETAASEPAALVEELSLKKAYSVFASLPKERAEGAVVIGSDTVVTLGGQRLGKPQSEEEAFSMLRAESGRVNVVYTGLAIVRMDPDQNACPRGPVCTVVHDSAAVRFAELSDEEILAYIKTGDPMDKAGAYGIQGPFSMFVEGVEGSYFTVVGLPVHLLYRELKRIGILPGGVFAP